MEDMSECILRINIYILLPATELMQMECKKLELQKTTDKTNSNNEACSSLDLCCHNVQKICHQIKMKTFRRSVYSDHSIVMCSSSVDLRDNVCSIEMPLALSVTIWQDKQPRHNLREYFVQQIYSNCKWWNYQLYQSKCVKIWYTWFIHRYYGQEMVSAKYLMKL